MKHLFLFAVLAASVGWAQTMADWSAANRDTLDKLRAEVPALAQEGRSAFERLTAAVKPDYKTDRLDSIRLAEMTRYVLAHRDYQKPYADVLAAAALKSTNADVTCIFLDQLRWCGYVEQEAQLKPLLQHHDRSVQEIAAVTLAAIRGDVRKYENMVEAKPLTEKELLAVKKQLQSADLVVVKHAARDLVQTAPLWLVADMQLAFASDDGARIALFRDVGKSIQQPDVLKSACAEKFDTYTLAGKTAALELLAARRVDVGVELALPLLDTPNKGLQRAAFRMLRACGGLPEADKLLPYLADADAESAFVEIAKRHPEAEETFVRLFKEKKIKAMVAIRIGPGLLKPVSDAMRSPDSEVAADVIRAMSKINSPQMTEILLKFALTAAEDVRLQTLSVRGVVQRMREAKPEERKAMKQMWQELDKSKLTDANHQVLEDCLK